MIYRHFVRPLLFRFDPENVHDFASHALARWHALLHPFRSALRYEHPALTQTALGLHFPNPIGLAAGFDKFAKATAAWPVLGFGFTEIGTITAQAQPGNPKPRLFRLPEDHALINRFGFNNAGATETGQILERLRTKGKLGVIPTGINIGKTKVVNLDQAVDDYLVSFRSLFAYGDYFVINVSSPNTPNLRELQDKTRLKELLAAIRAENLHRSGTQKPKPVLVKLSPDITLSQADDILEAVMETGAAGILATNTTVTRDELRSDPSLIREPGGLSGRPLRMRSTELIRHLYRRSEGKLLLIGVGGIFSGDDAYEKILAGASLVQVYTGFVYEGPFFCARINRRLHELLIRDGFRNVSEAVGKKA